MDKSFFKILVYFSFFVNALSRENNIDLTGSIRRGLAIEAALTSQNHNLVCSAISALLPAAQLAVGATGKTLHQLEQAVGMAKDDIGYGIRKMVTKLMRSKDITLHIASRLYVANKFNIKKTYKDLMVKYFKTSIGQIDFQDTDAAANEINKWVSSETAGKIEKLLKPADLSSGTVLVAVNAIYFQGGWKNVFPKAVKATFYSPKGQTEVPMMSREGSYMYTHSTDLKAQLVSIPYKAKDASLMILLPDEKDGLKITLRKLRLAPELLNTAIGKMTTRSVNLKIPKFTVSSQLDLKKLYQSLDITEIFGHDSGLTDILEHRNTPLKVSAALQKAIIDVTETGTEAAAASAIAFVGMSVPSNDVVTMTVDHPFHFVLAIYNQSLFSGAYSGD